MRACFASPFSFPSESESLWSYEDQRTSSAVGSRDIRQEHNGECEEMNEGPRTCLEARKNWNSSVAYVMQNKMKDELRRRKNL